jgi:aryl-alcohol dehydrogenase-like predicted oxidoreductase
MATAARKRSSRDAVLKTRGGERAPMVATKAGRRLNPHVADGYTKANIEGFIDRSLTNLRVDSLDLVQLHCPPTEVLYRPEMFDALNDLTRRPARFAITASASRRSRKR